MGLRFPIYLDYHASTPVDPRALEAMLPYFTEHFGNAASRTHAYGWKADDAVEAARRQVASLIGASAREVVFTSGATESNNLAIKGVAHARRERGTHVVTIATEHKAVLDSCKRLAHEAFDVTVLGVRPDGLVDLDRLRDAITDRTVLVSVMTANNEIGVLQPIAEIGAIAKEKGILFHTDAVQTVGKIPVLVAALGAVHVPLWSIELPFLFRDYAHAERVFEGQAHEAALIVERVRTAQQSYVADGQGVAYWMGKLDDTRAALARASTLGPRSAGRRS